MSYDDASQYEISDIESYKLSKIICQVHRITRPISKQRETVGEEWKKMRTGLI